MEKRSIEIQAENIAERIKLIKIGGVLDTITSAQAEETIGPLLADGEGFIFDCTNLEYMNSTGLALILGYYIHLKKRGKRLKLVVINKLLREILDISGALKLLEVCRTKEEALESLKGRTEN